MEKQDKDEWIITSIKKAESKFVMSPGETLLGILMAMGWNVFKVTRSFKKPGSPDGSAV